jgi:hypothetical protein
LTLEFIAIHLGRIVVCGARIAAHRNNEHASQRWPTAMYVMIISDGEGKKPLMEAGTRE